MNCLTSKLKDIPWVRHGFFTRQGGVSTGIFSSLNCGPGSDDKPLHVAENRTRVARALGVSDIATLWQIHSSTVLIVDGPVPSGEARPQADALVTVTQGQGIAVLTADCAPVLFASRKDKIVGAAHAGWKGAVGGVLENTIERMKSLGADPADLVAVIGPCIGPASYEVDAEFPAPFLAQDKGNERFFRKAEKQGHLMFDLPGYVAHRLRLAGITPVEEVGQDTFSDEVRFFSYRRACLRGEKDDGRQMSAIAIAQ